jgi:putative iron-dependent peroxidase
MSTTSILPASPQPSVLAPPPLFARSLVFRLLPKADPEPALRALIASIPLDWATIGIGEQIALKLDRPIPGLRTFPALSGPEVTIPSTQGSLWILLRADDFTSLYQHEGVVRATLREAFAISDAVNAFFYDNGRDLSGFEDGTANPKDDDAVAAAIVAEGPLAGSSFVGVQRWIHDLNRFAAFAPADADNIIGRHLTTNEEFEDAPDSAHVKRTAQELFDPEAFIVRRSMPWSNGDEHGLEFIAYGDTLDKYERMLRRMAGLDDGITDGLFSFSHPLSGGFYWVPPVRDGKVDLSALGL